MPDKQTKTKKNPARAKLSKKQLQSVRTLGVVGVKGGVGR